jgi:hypothetical protein
MGMNLRTTALGAACLAGVLLAPGCKEVQDIREEMGWAKQADAPPPAPVVNLSDRWIPADTGVADLDQAKWSQRWWAWAGRFEGKAPFQDTDGSRCAMHQEGPVWFLAGTDATFDAVRSCTIPPDTHLFVPLINWIVASDAPGPLEAPPATCKDRQDQATRMADHVVSGLVLLDGRPIGELQRMRVSGRTCFAASADAPVAAVDGYFLMLKPLPPGQHTLAVAAAYREGPRQALQNFQYTLEVQGAADAQGAEAAEAGDAGSLDDAADLAAEDVGAGSLDDAADIAK